MNKYLFISVLVTLYSCGNNSDKKSKINSEKNNLLSELNWLSGNWLFSEGKTSFYENWKIIDDSTFVGQGFVLSGADTIGIENLSLKQRNNEITYTAAIHKDKTTNSTDFTFTKKENASYLFENPAHDFPKRIIYKQNGSTKMSVVIDAGKDSTTKNQSFYFTRLSN
jgi:Domain of unknown function (DUF6265)